MIDGLIYYPDLLTKNQQNYVLSEIDKQVWSTELSRRVQHYGYKYNYKNRSIDSSMKLEQLPYITGDKWHFTVLPAMELWMKNLISELPDQLIINEYLPGQGIAAHIDCEPCFKDVIVSVSLGWPYEIIFTEVKTKKQESLLLEVGSALILRGEARYNWTHEIKRQKNDGDIPRQRRVSLTYRNVILNEQDKKN